jgi:hypothetical protein
MSGTSKTVAAHLKRKAMEGVSRENNDKDARDVEKFP